MTSSYTVNKSIEKPAYNDYAANPTGWSGPVNSDWDIIDKAFGGVTVKNPTGVSGTVNLVTSEYQSAILVIGVSVSSSATLTANVVYTIPSGVGGVWSIFNNTTGAYTVTFSSLGGGTSVVLDQGRTTFVFSDGTNVRIADNRVTNTAVPGSNTQVIYNSSGAFAASANLTFDGTYVSDGIGNVRTVPQNLQSGGYTLQASDNGKYVSLASGGVIVPPSIFSAGQVVSIYNGTGSTQTISAGSGVTLTLVGTSTTGNRSLTLNGIATLLCVGSNSFVVTGGGVS
jgi:hypothetical protein